MSTLSSVRRQIIAAFQSVPMPDASEITRTQVSNDLQGEDRIRQDLAGKRWDELSLEFMRGRSWSYYFLSAAAYQYYLPALLIAAVDNFEADIDFVHGVLFGLKPSAYAIYYEGVDTEFIERTSLFTSEQKLAVAAFHGLFLNADHLKFLTFMAAYSMRFGWGCIECPERRLFQEFDAQMRHYDYPPVTDTKIAGLISEIRMAFGETPYPGDDRLTESRQGDEAAGYALELHGVDWRTMHPDLVSSSALLTFFTSEGFRYFLPACLIVSLIEGNSETYELTHGFADAKAEWFDYGAHRMAGFTRSERVAIIHFLEYQAEQDEYQADEIRTAIDRYWKPSLETASMDMPK